MAGRDAWEDRTLGLEGNIGCAHPVKRGIFRWREVVGWHGGAAVPVVGYERSGAEAEEQSGGFERFISAGLSRSRPSSPSRR
jgi:hypothetical protein